MWMGGDAGGGGGGGGGGSCSGGGSSGGWCWYGAYSVSALLIVPVKSLLAYGAKPHNPSGL